VAVPSVIGDIIAKSNGERALSCTDFARNSVIELISPRMRLQPARLTSSQNVCA